MSEYKIENIRTAEALDPMATYLWVWHADKVPPHIGVSTENKYFSLKANGKDEDVSIEQVISIINKKDIVTLAFELKMPISADQLNYAFDGYSTTIPEEVTCLNPIKEFLEVGHAQRLIDLLDYLYENRLVEKVVGYNSTSFTGIKNYSSKDIHQRLHKLSNGE